MERIVTLLPLLLLCMLPSAAARNLSFGVAVPSTPTPSGSYYYVPPTDANAPTDPPPRFAVVSNEATCADAGYEPIVTLAECEEALEYLEYDGTLPLESYHMNDGCVGGTAMHYGCSVGIMGPVVHNCATFLSNIQPSDAILGDEVYGVGYNDILMPVDGYCKTT